jgi:amidase
MNELVHRTATELAAIIRRRDVSSREVVEAHLARIAAVNGTVNAITVVLADDALAAADAADRSEPTGALHGVPITIKENIDLIGSATTDGLPALEHAMPVGDAPVVERLKAAGAIPIARTNLPELGLRLDTDNPLHGRTHNPWRHDVTAGGSSGGEAASLATGMSPLGLGNDIGGSLRNPAFCCGVAGLRPTMGRVPSAGSVDPVDPAMCGQLMATDGAIARSVADLRLALELLNGSHWRSPTSVDVAIASPAPPRRVAAIVDTAAFGVVDPAIARSVHDAGAALEAAGWAVEHVKLPELAFVNEIWMRIMCADLELMIPAVRQIVTAPVIDLLEQHSTVYDLVAMPTAAVWPQRHRLMRAWSEWFRQYSVVVSPVWPEQAFPAAADLDRGIEYVARMLQFVTPAPLLGLPAVAVPTGVHDGLPVGVQVQADRWRDDWCLDAAAAIEATLGSYTPIDPVA